MSKKIKLLILLLGVIVLNILAVIGVNTFISSRNIYSEQGIVTKIVPYSTSNDVMLATIQFKNGMTSVQHLNSRLNKGDTVYLYYIGKTCLSVSAEEQDLDQIKVMGILGIMFVVITIEIIVGTSAFYIMYKMGGKRE